MGQPELAFWPVQVTLWPEIDQFPEHLSGLLLYARTLSVGILYLPMTNIKREKQTDAGRLLWRIIYGWRNVDRLCIKIGLPKSRPISIAIAPVMPSPIAVTAVLMTPPRAVVTICERRRYRANADCRSKDKCDHDLIEDWSVALNVLYWKFHIDLPFLECLMRLWTTGWNAWFRHNRTCNYLATDFLGLCLRSPWRNKVSASFFCVSDMPA